VSSTIKIFIAELDASLRQSSTLKKLRFNLLFWFEIGPLLDSSVVRSKTGCLAEKKVEILMQNENHVK